MAEVLWKNLAKDIGDLTKISDEIDSKLVTHNTDESAHSQSNEAIYNHRVGVILDHLDGSVTALKIKDLAVETAKIDDLAVETGKIKDLAVETAKIAALAVETGKIKDLAVETAKIAALAVETAKIAALAVTSAKIDDLAVTSAKIDDLAVETAKIKDLSVETIKIKDGATTGIKLAVSGKVADAIVAASGGDYTDIQSAIDAGKKAIFVKRGTYSLNADIDIPSDVSIFGEDKYDTIIDLNGDHQIKSVGDTPYTSGTITTEPYSNVLVGSGTSWLANLAVNDYIVFNGAAYKITAVTDDTHITIEIVYGGVEESGISYSAGTFLYDVDISSMTVKNQVLSSAKAAVYFYGVVKSSIYNIIIKENDLEYTYGVRLEYSYNNTLSSIGASNNGNFGVYLWHSDNNILSGIVANNNTSAGVGLGYSNNNTLSNIVANSNTGDGVYFLYSDNNILSNIISKSNYNNGVTLYYSNNNTLSNIVANGNSIDGIYLKYSDNNALSNIISNNNGDNGIYLFDSDSNTFSISSVTENSDDGVKLYKSSYNVISNNIIRDNSQKVNNSKSEIFLTDNGSTYSTYNIISSNNIKCTKANKSKYGIRENAAGDNYNLVHGNVVQGAVTANISLQGANSVNADNI